MRSPSDLIANNLELVSLPPIIYRLNEMVEDPQCSSSDIANLVLQEPSLSKRLVKIANSPYYNLPSKVDSISMAITIIGTRQLKDMILATTIINHFQSLPDNSMPVSEFWRHSITCASACNVIARKLRNFHHERFFLVGLLHDIGKLVMYLTMPEESRQVIRQAKEEAAPLTSLEKKVFNFDHCEVGAELLRQWNFPESLIIPVKYHHAPHKAEGFQQKTAAVHLANAIANTLKPCVSPDDDLPVAPDTWYYLGLPEAMLEKLINETGQNMEQIIEMLYPHAV